MKWFVWRGEELQSPAAVKQLSEKRRSLVWVCSVNERIEEEEEGVVGERDRFSHQMETSQEEVSAALLAVLVSPVCSV